VTGLLTDADLWGAPAPATPAAAPAALLSDEDLWGKPPPQGFVAGANSAAVGLVDQINAAVQNTSPIVAGLEGRENYRRAPDSEQWLYREQGVVRDPKKYVALRDPQSGELAVFERAPETDESRLTSLGRVLGVGAVTAPATRLPALAETAGKTADLVQDFERIKVDPTLPAVAQNRGVSTIAQAMRETPIAGQPVASGAQKSVEQTGKAAETIASGYGEATTPVQAGRGIQAGAQEFVSGKNAAVSADDAIRLPTRATSLTQKAEALYGRAGAMIDKTAPVALDNTASALQGVAGRFSSSAEFGATLVDPKFKSWYDKLQQAGTLTWDELKEFRSYVGRKISQPMVVADIPRADLKNLYAGISKDLSQAALDLGGPGAQRAYAQADKYWSAGMGRVEKAISDVLKVDNPEAAYQQIISAAQAKGGRADIGKLYALRRSMSDEEWSDVASTVINQMGRKTPGASDPLAATNFSPATFVTEYQKLSDEAKALLFRSTGNAELKKSLDSLVNVAAAQKNVEKLANTSGTGRVGITAAIGAGTIADLPKTLAVLGGVALGGQLMMWPPFVRWLTATNSIKTPAAMASHVARLSGLATKQPELAAALGEFQAALERDGSDDSASSATAAAR
jgi:hypothetical protein